LLRLECCATRHRAIFAFGSIAGVQRIFVQLLPKMLCNFFKTTKLSRSPVYHVRGRNGRNVRMMMRGSFNRFETAS
jgi:hypothetical protein